MTISFPKSTFTALILLFLFLLIPILSPASPSAHSAAPPAAILRLPPERLPQAWAWGLQAEWGLSTICPIAVKMSRFCCFSNSQAFFPISPFCNKLLCLLWNILLQGDRVWSSLTKPRFNNYWEFGYLFNLIPSFSFSLSFPSPPFPFPFPFPSYPFPFPFFFFFWGKLVRN